MLGDGVKIGSDKRWWRILRKTLMGLDTPPLRKQADDSVSGFWISRSLCGNLTRSVVA